MLTQSKAIDLILRMVKQFLSQKITDRLKIIKSLEELHQKVERDILPVEYGGKERPIRNILGTNSLVYNNCLFFINRHT